MQNMSKEMARDLLTRMPAEAEEMGMRYRPWYRLQYVESMLNVFIRKEMVAMGMRYRPWYRLQYVKSVLRDVFIRKEMVAMGMRYLYSLQYEKSIRNASKETY